MCVFVRVIWTCVLVSVEVREGIGSPGAGGRGRWEPPHMGAEHDPRRAGQAQSVNSGKERLGLAWLTLE